MDEKKYFYDIHCHAFNLSHPNLMAFAKRINLHAYLLLNAVPGLSTVLSPFIGGKIDSLMNLLSIMENDLGTYFLLMEQDAVALMSNGKLIIGDHAYDKIILTPLIMDFGYKGVEKFPNIHYSQIPQKPIAEQVFDLFFGIKDYSENVLVKDAGGQFGYQKANKEDKLFEIYPFLGINTQRYSKAEVEGLLVKYFSGYTRDRGALYKKMGLFGGDVDTMDSNFFAGIKVYPPLGFDPWPEDGEEKKKVECLYSMCIEKKIPITTHCSDGGFITDDRAEIYTAPSRWAQALEQYGDLRINFAHFGAQSKWFTRKTWMDDILTLMSAYPHVYADVSYRGIDSEDYKFLRELIDDNKTPFCLKDRVLFGTDFMINLRDIDSYSDYLRQFAATLNPLVSGEKDLFCSTNPERFLFGS